MSINPKAPTAENLAIDLSVSNDMGDSRYAYGLSDGTLIAEEYAPDDGSIVARYRIDLRVTVIE